MAESGGDDATIPGRNPGLAATLPAQVDYAELTQIDRAHYMVSGELARGGMGRILAARDRRLGRPVAIKELLGDDDDLRMRFEREARITARLQHPAIVNVLEAGTWPNGEPFYVMRLVVGESMEKAIKKAWTLRERLALLPNVIAAVDALAYAHSLRIIHRDLKPHNVLVGEFGETVVIDWGLAKDLGEIESPRTGVSGTETVAGSVMGTPAYMPIEQAEGADVTERADVYALGAMLYHLLSGVAPYAGASGAEIIAAVVSGPPPSLASRVEGVPSDLLAIVDKAMAYKAEDRYANASELAVDLKKFQTGQLVGAHSYSSWQLVRRWIGKHRAVVSVTGVAVLLLGIVGAFSVRKILREQERTEFSRNEAEDLSGFMLTNLHDKLQPLGKLDLLDDVAQKVVAYYGGRGDDLSDAELRNRALAQRQMGDVSTEHGRIGDALAMYRAATQTTEWLANESPEDVGRQQDLRFNRLRVAQALAARSDVAGAIATVRAVQATDNQMAHRRPDDIEWAWYVALSHDAAGYKMRANRQFDEARQEFTAMCADLERLIGLGDGGRTTLLGANGRIGPVTKLWRGELALCHQRQGNLMLATGDISQAALMLNVSLLEYEMVLAEDPNDVTTKASIADSHAQLAFLAQAQRKTSTAINEFRAQLAINERLAIDDPTNATRVSSVANARQMLAEVLLDQGDSSGARDEYVAAIDSLTRLTEKDKTNILRMDSLAEAHRALGDVYLQRAEMALADEEYQRSMAILSPLKEANPKDVATLDDMTTVEERIGDMKKSQGDFDGAEAAYLQEVEGNEIVLGLGPLDVETQRTVGISHDKLGRLYLESGKYDKALAQFKTYASVAAALAAKDPRNASWQVEVGFSHMHLGIALRRLHDLPTSIKELKEAEVIFRRLGALDAKDLSFQNAIASVLDEAGVSRAEAGELPAAVSDFKEALAVFATLQALDPLNMDLKGNAVRSHRRLGEALASLGSPEAVEENRQATRLCDEQIGKGMQAPHPSECEEARLYLAESLMTAKQLDEARVIFERVVASQSRVLERAPRDEGANFMTGRCELSLATIAESKGDEPTAALHYRRYRDSIAISSELKPGDRTMILSRLWAEAKVNEHLRLHKEFSASLSLARQDLQLVQEQLATTPDDVDLKGFHGQFEEDIGDALMGMGQASEAAVAYKSMVAIAQQAVLDGDKTPMAALNIAEAKERLGNALARADLKAARASYEDALKIAQDLVAKDPKTPAYAERAASIQKKLAALPK